LLIWAVESPKSTTEFLIPNSGKLGILVNLSLTRKATYLKMNGCGFYLFEEGYK
jgi:hypothetical protein